MRFRYKKWGAIIATTSLAILPAFVPTAAAADDEPTQEVATEQVCVSHDQQPTDFGPSWSLPGDTSWPTLELPRFDAELGTYLRTELVFEIEATSEYGLRHFGNGVRNVTVTNTVDAKLLHDGVEVIALQQEFGAMPTEVEAVYPNGDEAGSLPDWDDYWGHAYWNGPDATQGIVTETASSGVQTSTDTALWVGDGDVTLDAEAGGWYRASGSGNNATYSKISVGSSACVQHFYIPAADPEPELVSVGDFVWFDTNRDGIQDAGEPGAPGVTVNLIKDGEVADTTVTDADGHYWFTDLLPGTEYSIEFIAPPGEAIAFTTQNAGGVEGNDPAGDVNDSDVDPETGRVSFNTPDAGDNVGGPGVADNSGIDAGLLQYNLTLTKTLTTEGPFVPGSIVAYTLVPSNEGPVDALAGWSVTDVLPVGLEFVSMSSESDEYAFDGQTAVSSLPLPAGSSAASLVVTAKVDATFAGSAKNVAYIAPSDDDVDETNPLAVPDLDTDTAASPTDNDAEASLSVPLVSVGDFVWFDTNRDGLQDAGEPGAPGVTVNLILDGEIVETTVTNTEGYYWFTDLLPATEYEVEFLRPSGEAIAFTSENAGGVTSNDPEEDLNDSDVDPDTGGASFTTPVTGENRGGKADADNPGIDAGLLQYNLKLEKSLLTTEVVHKGDTVTFELIPSNDGPVDALAGWTVTEVLPEELELVSLTSESSEYTFDGATATSVVPLASGASAAPITVTAKVVENLSGSVKNIAYVAPSPNDVEETIPLGQIPGDGTDTSQTATDNDAEAPVLITSLVSIGDYVWVDVNRDGRQNDGNPVAGVVVNLYEADGTTLVATTATSETGFYSFGDLRPSTDYVLEFHNPEGYSFTEQHSGDSANDSDPDPETGRVSVTTPAIGANSLSAPDDSTIDAGLVKFNLVLTKALVSEGPFYSGGTVQFELITSNDGPSDALGGWSIVEVPDNDLEIVSIDGGDSYRCDLEAASCVSEVALAAGARGAPILVTAVIDEAYIGDLYNVAYVVPAEGEVIETNPLEVPRDARVDTAATQTDNDSHVAFSVLAPVPPTDDDAEQDGSGAAEPVPSTPGGLASTGADLAGGLGVAAAALLFLISGILLLERRRRLMNDGEL